MKLRGKLALVTLIEIGKGTLLAAIVQPFILGFGAILAAVDLDVLDVQPIEWKNWLPFDVETKQSKSETKETKEEKELTYKELLERHEKKELLDDIEEITKPRPGDPLTAD